MTGQGRRPSARVERGFERLIWRFRLVTLVPVVMSLLGSVSCFAIGTYAEISVLGKVVQGHFTHATSTLLIGKVVGGIDYYLIGIALLIFGYGIYELIILELQPACFGGITRYTSSASPAQFCFEGQQSLPRGGPPIPSIVAVFLIMGVGVQQWRKHRWPWFGLGGLQMLLAAAVPFSEFGLLPGNGGEVILQFAFVATAYRFSSGWQKGS